MKHFYHAPKYMQKNGNFLVSSVIVCKLIEKYPRFLKYARRRSISRKWDTYLVCNWRAVNGGGSAATPEGQTAHTVAMFLTASRRSHART